MIIVAGTGHRPDKLGGYHESVYDRILDTAMLAIDEQKPTILISGMALGWDTALAEAAYLLDIPFKAYIPFEGQESKWPAASQRLYRNLLALAAEVVYCSEPGYSAYKMQVRNARMVDDAGIVIALWDGSPGGTSNCIEYATAQEVQVVNYWKHFDEQPFSRSRRAHQEPD